MNHAIWIVAILLVGMVVACDDSYHEAQMEAEHYTDMVCNGYWPDYDEREPDCGAWNGRDSRD
jgi:hypothetical protein